MNKRSLTAGLFFTAHLIGCSNIEDPESSNSVVVDFKELIDDRDGKSYRTLTIGTQTWMAENLNFSIFNSSCYLDEHSFCEKYGRLYAWDAATKACPTGWHLPSDEEWKTLEIEIGMSILEVDKLDPRGTNEGKKLKSQYGWRRGGGGSDAYGFGGLPASQRNSGGSFGIDSILAFWWTSSRDSNNNEAYYRVIRYYDSTISRKTQNVNIGNSVRCIKN